MTAVLFYLLAFVTTVCAVGVVVTQNIVRAAAWLLAEETGRRVVGTALDVTRREEAERAVATAVEATGRLDVLVNNAGVGYFGRTVEELSGEDWRQTIETNLHGVFYCCHNAIPIMKACGGGYIFNISSLAGQNAHPKMAAYNASKFGLNGFNEALMQEVRHDNIKVSYIMPGSVNTEFGGDEPSEAKSWQLQPADVARVVRPGGRVLVVDMLPHERQEYQQQMGHVWLGFSEKQIGKFLTEAGFSDVRTRLLPADPDAKGPALFAAVGMKK